MVTVFAEGDVRFQEPVFQPFRARTEPEHVGCARLIDGVTLILDRIPDVDTIIQPVKGDEFGLLRRPRIFRRFLGDHNLCGVRRRFLVNRELHVLNGLRRHQFVAQTARKQSK
jgi:hypothetical protein